MDSNLDLVKFASLLHDIGKFYQRMDNQGSSKKAYDSKFDELSSSDYGENGAHGKWSADFVSKFYDDEVENLVLYHHNPSKSMDNNLCSIIQKADHHSSRERNDAETKQNVLESPLISIFSRINDSSEYYIPLKELDIDDSIYPKEYKEMSGYNLQPDYKTLWAKFIKEFEKINSNDFDTVLALMKKYTSTIPSAAYKSVSDISLYDHAKTTAALATCRYLYSLEDKLFKTKDEQKVYLIINGDISGIQKFIYKISTPEDAQSGMSKRLRGRSLYLTLLSEAVTSRIINDLNLNSSNIIFCGGGRFTIVAPNTDKVKNTLNTIRNELNMFFIEKFNAELYLSLVSEEASGNDLTDFGQVIKNLNTKLNSDKKHKFAGNLDKVFKIEDKVNYDKLCPVCGNKLEKSSDDTCFECQDHEELGQKAANANYIIKYTANFELDDSSFYVEFLKTGYIFKKSNSDVLDIIKTNPDVKFIIYRLNDTNFLTLCDEIKSDNVSFDFKFLGNNVPNIKGKPLYFQHLAQISKGANKLGILKMDVDNLGTIFSDGFNHLDKGASISKISSLSFYMDVFFSGVINTLVNKYRVYTSPEGLDEYEEIKLDFDGEIKPVYKGYSDSLDNSTSTIYINYSGGDDLLVLGPYDDIIRFAQDFRCEFKKWTAQNPAINISAGITIVGAKFPIGKAADMAEEFLESSKNCGRDKITVFNEVLAWDTKELEKGFDEIFEFANELESYTENKNVSKGFVYSLLRIWESKFNRKKQHLSSGDDWSDDIHNRLSSKAFVPIFKYKLRLISDKDIRNDIDKKGIKLMPWIKTPVSWVSLRLR
ncbi:type III-A CRISPR-associated protein Cas10/Csm1 [uncultured Methanobrevibacter sp.]|uniref:type III-A CRISPR-associated protein Cas10/Csm1 n=1 Tax=uncultured Methanobrevibacter sp. TaxID=253161 RepID=UPI0025FD47F8|nr:type III-A CRISPR-associated protein Cas10/Csm1 [uncultured Methanobrevibacter sp.]